VITLNATYQQSKSVVDAVNGTYQTVLTIDPSVEQDDIVGTYNCTVENIRGESSETVVVPGNRMFLLFSVDTTVVHYHINSFVDLPPNIEYVSNHRMTGIFGHSNVVEKLCKNSAIPQDCSGGTRYLVY